MVLMNCQKMVLMERSDGTLFTYVSILFSSTEVLPNFLAPCSLFGIMSMLS